MIVILLIKGIDITHAQCTDNIYEGIQKIIDSTCSKFNIPAVQVSIICPGEREPHDFVRGYVAIDSDMLVQPNHLFQIGSLTKSFASSLVLKLEADGVLSIHDPISKWLPQYSDWDTITIQNLLNHTSGIHDYVDSEEFMTIQQKSHYKKQWVRVDLVNLVKDLPPYFKPGQGFHYSDINYLLAGMIIEAATGQSVEELLNSQLIFPSQLSNTYYIAHPYSQNIKRNMVHGYKKNDDGIYVDTIDYNMSAEDMAGAIISTSHDASLWFKKLLMTNTLLPQKQKDEMMSLVDDNIGKPIPQSSTNSGYGLGIRRDYDTLAGEVWGHRGATYGYSANMVWLKKNNVIITTMINLKSNQNASTELITNLIAFAAIEIESNNLKMNKE